MRNKTLWYSKLRGYVNLEEKIIYYNQSVTNFYLKILIQYFWIID